jgi:hypothetical protein
VTKVKLKHSIEGLYETLYEVGLERSREEETSVTKHPHKQHKPNGKPASESQKAQRQRFKLAVAYARTALANPEIRAQYKVIAGQLGKSPWRAAFHDYLQGNDLLSKQ